MNTDDFEQRLQRLPLRSAPEAWREQILDAVRAGSETRVQDPTSPLWRYILREWLWPHPAAWGTLAACWVAIFVLRHATAPTAAELEQAHRDARVAAAYSSLLSHPAAMAVTAEPIVDPLPARSERRSPDLGRRATPAPTSLV